MSKNLTELNDPPTSLISDDDYKHWMKTHKLGDTIPTEIHRYFMEVLFPDSEIRYKNLSNKWGLE